METKKNSPFNKAQKADSKTDFFYNPFDGNVFFDKALTKKMYCSVHPRTQLKAHDGRDDRLNCPTCTRLGLGLHWRIHDKIDRYKAGLL